MPSGAGQLLRRVAFSAVAIPVAVVAAYAGGWVLAALLAVVGVLATREVYDLAAQGGVDPLRRSGLVAAAVIPLATYWAKGSEIHFAEPAIYLGALWMIAVIAAAAWRRGPGGRPLSAVAVTVFGVLYAPGLLGFAIVLRHPTGLGLDSRPGTALLFFPLALTWIGDTAAMAGGKLIGGPKLAPTLSPSKTWAGAWCGLAAAVLAAWAYATWILDPLGRSLPLAAALLAGAAIGVTGQAGDLAESLLKREVGVKDSSGLIPGHGGMLDRIDSLLFVLPVTAGLFRILGLT
ncbi:MAG TPA: phosphatidate cytidylyltransferase [Gemmatimonadales bacterium]|nr:phosphatidate cytidylyltransferase [Gemmatimonadales bacterium]